jgi:fructosamine-3-kinase
MRGFLKQGQSESAGRYAAEADGLEALRPHIRVPRVLDRGVKEGKAFILLERLDLKRGGDYAQLGRMLAGLHRQTGPRFGWHRDNHIGLTPQQNGWCDDWTQFWRERRLRPQIELANRNGFRLELPDPAALLENHKPEASLLHGDLWSGNAGFTREGPVIFDPAVYYGDRETDLAMTELFGGFPREFYEAYNEAFPLDAGYGKRKHLYNLYHLLNHLNLFGGGYLGQVKETLRLLGL